MVIKHNSTGFKGETAPLITLFSK